MQELKGGVQYRDRRFEGDEDAYNHALATSVTVYVGNLAFTTREEQLYEVRPSAARINLGAQSAYAFCSFLSGTSNTCVLLLQLAP